MTTTTHESPHGLGGRAGEEPPPLRTYFLIFAALLALLFLTVALAFLPARGPWRDALTAVGFIIAGAKALLIILWFMHVKQGPRLVLVFSLGAFFFLGVMFSLSMSDYRTRDGVPGVQRPEPRVTSDDAHDAQTYDEHKPDGRTGAYYER